MILFFLFLFFSHAFSADFPVYAVYQARITVDGAPAPAGSVLTAVQRGTSEILSRTIITVPGIAGPFYISGITERTQINFYLDKIRLKTGHQPVRFEADYGLHELILYSGAPDTTRPVITESCFIAPDTVRITFSETIICQCDRKLFYSSHDIKTVQFLKQKNGLEITFDDPPEEFVQLQFRSGVTDVADNRFKQLQPLVIKKIN